MHNRSKNHLFQYLSCGLVAVFLLAFTLVTTSNAQEKAVNRIEVKDGKVYVNGEMVKELEDADRPVILLSGNGDENHQIAFFSDDEHSGKAFTFSGSGSEDHAFAFDGEHNEIFSLFGKTGNVLFAPDHMARLNKFDFNISPDVFFSDENLRWRSFAPDNLYFSNRGKTDEIRRLEMKSRELARSYRSATETERSGLADDLKRILEKIFDLKESTVTERLEKMRDELAKLTLRVEERHLSKEDIISRRYQELIGEKDTLSW